jgi:hypothetical protein
VEHLQDSLLTTPSGRKVCFSVQEIPVSYDDIPTIIPIIHKKGYDYIIHLGVGRNGFITLERRAHSGGYYGKDIHGKSGPIEDRGVVYVTKWDVETLINELYSLGFKVRPPVPILGGRVDGRILLCQMMLEGICVNLFISRVWRSLLKVRFLCCSAMFLSMGNPLVLMR